MKVDYLILADSVAVAEGKHYIHGGGWDTLFAASFPALHPVLAIAARLRVPSQDIGQQFALEVDVVNSEEGRSLLPEPLRGIVNAERPPYAPPYGDLLIPFALSFTTLQFDLPGTSDIFLRIARQPLA